MSKKDEKRDEEANAGFEKYRETIQHLLDAGETGLALIQLKRYDKTYKDVAEFAVLWGRYYAAIQDPGKAITRYLRAIELNSDRPDYYRSAADLYHQMGDHKAAANILWEGIENCSDPMPCYLWLERFCAGTGDKEMAIRVIENLKSRYKDRGEVYYKQGEAAYAMGLIPTAIDFFRQSLDHDYIGQSHYCYLGDAFASCDEIDQAIFFYRKSLQDNPDNAAALDGLHNTLKWRAHSADEKLLAALDWKKASVTGNLFARIQSVYLDISETTHDEVLTGWLAGDRYDVWKEYVAFCRFYRYLLMSCPDHSSHNFKARHALVVCVQKLQELDRPAEATLYDAWLAVHMGNTKRAEALFNSLVGDESTPESLTCEIQQGLEHVRGVQTPPAMPVPTTGDNILAKYGINLNRHVDSDSCLGLESVVNRMADILAHGTKKSLILTGPSGVGKTAAVRDLARRINVGQCPEPLRGFAIYQVSTTAIVSGAIYIGQWQQRLEEICQAGQFGNRVLLYLEDVANILGVGKTSGDASRFADYLIPRMEQGQVVVIGEMDTEQAQAVYWEEPRFERVVTSIPVDEPKETELVDIVMHVAEKEGEAGRVKFTQDSISETIDVARVYMPYKAFPGKAIDVVRKAIELFGRGDHTHDVRITPEDIILTFCEMTGIPEFVLDQSQQLNLDQMKTFFSERILGQDETVAHLCQAVTTFKARLHDEKRPIKSLFFVGPTGVGKTESAKVLAEFLFGSQDRILRLNMSEYNDYSAVGKLLGTQHPGDKRSSRFLDGIRQNPFGVVLLDEIEKAHADVLNLLLQMLDEGILSDAGGKPAYFRSAIIIMTSNIGARRYTGQTIGFGAEDRILDIQAGVMSDIKEFFSPEVFNRIDNVICFRPLNKQVLGTIINREIGRVLERRGILSLEISVDVDPLVKDYIIERGYDPKYGARHIKRVVERAVALPLATVIASTRLQKGSYIRINIRNGEPTADVITTAEAISAPESVGSFRQPDEAALTIPDRGLKKMLLSMESRISSLKARLHYDEVISEKESLQIDMVRPTFWDNPGRANNALKRFAELNRKTERIHRWEDVFDRIRAAIDFPAGKVTRAETAHAKSQVIGLMKDLDSAEMEILLEGKYDFADAYLILSADGVDTHHVKWLNELAGVYINWARRRGYQSKIFGERAKDEAAGVMLLVHIGGLNAFGLLKNERGIHRKVIVRKAGKKQEKVTCDCRVLTLADVQSAKESVVMFNKRITKINPQQKGWKIKSLSHRVELHHKPTGLGLAFLCDTIIERDKNLIDELFLSYLEYHRNKGTTESGRSPGVWGSLVRTYEAGSSSQIIDYASQMIIKHVKDYLGGKIDSLLLERII